MISYLIFPASEFNQQTGVFSAGTPAAPLSPALVDASPPAFIQGLWLLHDSWV